MNYTTEYLEDGTILIANQVIRGGVRHDIGKDGNIIIRNNTFYVSSDEFAIEIIDSREYPKWIRFSLWITSPLDQIDPWLYKITTLGAFAFPGAFRRLRLWIRSRRKPMYWGSITNNFIISESQVGGIVCNSK